VSGSWVEISFLRQAKFPYESVISGSFDDKPSPWSRNSTHDQKCHSILLLLLLHFTARLESPHLFGPSGRSRIAPAASSGDFRGPDGPIEMNFSRVWPRRCLYGLPGGKFCAPSRKEGAEQDIYRKDQDAGVPNPRGLHIWRTPGFSRNGCQLSQVLDHKVSVGFPLMTGAN